MIKFFLLKNDRILHKASKLHSFIVIYYVEQETKKIGFKMENALTQAMWQDGMQTVCGKNSMNLANSVNGTKLDKN